MPIRTTGQLTPPVSHASDLALHLAKLFLYFLTTVLITGITNAYAAGARQNQAKIVEDCPVEEVLVERLSSGTVKVTGVKTKRGTVGSTKKRLK